MAKKAVSEVLFDDFVKELQRTRASKTTSGLSDKLNSDCDRRVSESDQFEILTLKANNRPTVLKCSISNAA